MNLPHLPSPLPVPHSFPYAGALKDFIAHQAVQAYRRNNYPRSGPGFQAYLKTHPYSMAAQYDALHRRQQGNPSPWDKPFSHALLELPAQGLWSGANWLAQNPPRVPIPPLPYSRR